MLYDQPGGSNFSIVLKSLIFMEPSPLLLLKTLKRFLRTRLFYVRNWLNHGKRKKQLCYPTASEKLYYDSKYQTDRICQFQLISNSVCMYLSYFLKGTTPLMMITGKPYRDAASVLNFDLRNRKPTFKISFLLKL
jgi:hypothetical protein